jgi:curved DNA-binding protein CbpA
MSDWNEWVKKIKRAYEALDDADYYAILSIPRDADGDAIRKAYYLRARQLHPDKVRNLPEPARSQAVAIFKRVAEGYRTLTDPEQKRAYDEALRKGKKRLLVSDRLTLKPKTEYDFLSTEAGKKYYIAAKKALESGNVANAKLNIRLAIQYEGEKKELLALLKRCRT